MAKAIFAQIDSYNKNGKKSTKRTAEEAMWSIMSNGTMSIRCYLEADGLGYIQITRNGEPLHRFEFANADPENN